MKKNGHKSHASGWGRWQRVWRKRDEQQDLENFKRQFCSICGWSFGKHSGPDPGCPYPYSKRVK